MDKSSNDIYLNITIDENDVFEGAKEIIKRLRPDWSTGELKFKIFTDGITNRLLGVYFDDYYRMVLIRIYGKKTNLLVDRQAEIRNIRILHKAGYTHSLYATFNNGLVYEFLPGEILTVEAVRQPEIYKLVAKRMAQMHRLDPQDPMMVKEPMIWDKIDCFMSLMPRRFEDPIKQAKYEKKIKPFDILEQEYKLLKEQLSKLDSPVVYCHNDLLLANILYDKRDKSVVFIDFEYTAFNYQAFDIANHFAEFAGVENIDYSLYPDETLQRSWLRMYLQVYNKCSNVSEDEVTKVYKQVEKFVLAAHFLWGCWAIVQYDNSSIDFDFLQFSADRFNEYFRRKAVLGDK
ncbi:ethanolamine kinase 1 isoform X1 [Diachasmimorpha longicaudata]|uniref:ethanolamine kinase 1 isoform X1 n=2 Tax=Diachasmimorpha longicaudata TaxID=58733 RepID=UPI0030B8CF23